MTSPQLTFVIKQFDRLKAETLKETLQVFNKQPAGTEKAKKAELLSLVKTLVLSHTYAFMLEDMTTFKQWFATDLKVASDDVLKELETHGLSAGLERLTDATHKAIMEKFSLQEDDDTRPERIKHIEEEVFLQGANKLIYKLPTNVLKLYCADLKLDFTGDVSNDAELLMKSMFNLDGGEEDDEEEEDEDKKVEDKKEKKSAAESKKKPAAKKAATTKKPTAATKKQAAAAKKKAPAKPTAASAKPAEADGKRVRKPVNKLETEVAANGNGSTSSPSKKDTTTKKDTTKKRKKDDDDDDEKTPVDSSRPNQLGGYYENGKYVDPPMSKLTKSLDAGDIHNFFNYEALQQYCRDHNITGYSGLTKQKLIRQKIIPHLNGKDVNKKPKQPKVTKKSTKKSKTSTTTSTTTASEK